MAPATEEVEGVKRAGGGMAIQESMSDKRPAVTSWKVATCQQGGPSGKDLPA